MKPIAVTDGSALSVSLLLMFFIMAMIWIEEVANLADLVFEMKSLHFCIIQLTI